jgi:hypothetical protein
VRQGAELDADLCELRSNSGGRRHKVGGELPQEAVTLDVAETAEPRGRLDCKLREDARDGEVRALRW